MLQWVLDGYLLTLSALLLLGGALGDRYGRRRIFLLGLVLFTLASLGCGLAPTGGGLIVARLVQGIGGALLVPGSLALIDATIRSQDRGRAVGTWAGLTGVSSALGPFIGGWLVDAVSWRWVFFINVPLAAAALAVTPAGVWPVRARTRRGGCARRSPSWRSFWVAPGRSWARPAAGSRTLQSGTAFTVPNSSPGPGRYPADDPPTGRSFRATGQARQAGSPESLRPGAHGASGSEVGSGLCPRCSLPGGWRRTPRTRIRPQLMVHLARNHQVSDT